MLNSDSYLLLRSFTGNVTWKKTKISLKIILYEDEHSIILYCIVVFFFLIKTKKTFPSLER